MTRDTLAHHETSGGDSLREPAADPERFGVSRQGLAELTAAMASAAGAERTAGIITLVARNGGLVHLEAAGKRGMETGAPLRVDDIVRIASMTKPVTGVAMMMLFEQGLWGFDDPVEKHVPEFAGMSVLLEDGSLVAPKRAMTMLDLMRQTAGLGYIVLDGPVDRLYAERKVLDPDADLQAMVRKVGSLPLAFHPGERWYYSVAVDVQGLIIERLSGLKLDAFFAERIFQPLGMVDTGFAVPPQDVERLATVYVYDAEGRLTPKRDLPVPTEMPALLSGGSGLYSTALDYLRFCQMLLNGGELYGARLLEPQTVRLINDDHLPEGVHYGLMEPAPGESFGLDVAIVADPDRAKTPMSAGTYWWGGAYGTWFSIDPAKQLILMGLTQLTDSAVMTPAELRQESIALAYTALL